MSNPGKRLDRLADTADGGASIANQMQAASERQRQRQKNAWRAAGNEGRPPHDPMAPIDAQAPRSHREMWRQIAHGRARVIHIGTPETSPFESVAEAYAMSDADLMRPINSYPSAAVWP